LCAWVDESINDDPETGFYVLAAALTTEPCDSIRAELRRLLLRRQRRLHWRDERDDRREQIAEVIAAADIAGVVVVGAKLAPRKQERARRLCMERLLHELDDRDVTQVWLEKRTETLNAKDRQMVFALRGSRTIRNRLRVDHADPNVEAMLWIPDAIAGAVRARRVGLPSVEVRLETILTEITIELR
jgi:hypothetical protein